MAGLASLPITFEETFDALSGVLADAERTRMGFRAQFEALNARQQITSTPVDPPIESERPRAGSGSEPRRAISSSATPFGVELPERTTHGGDFGPKVRQKLIADALERRGGW